MELLEVTDSKLVPPTDFSFPGTPYSIQNDFMENLFKALDERALGIFESPTGTGKSLSLLCGSLTWLEKREEQRLLDLKYIISGFDEEAENEVCKNAKDWISAQFQLRKRKNQILKAKRELKFLEDGLAKRKKSLDRKAIKQVQHYSEKMSKSKINTNRAEPAVSLDKIKDGSSEAVEQDNLYFNEDFAPDFNSDSDTNDEDDDNENEEPEFYPLKVIFGSRTHSQLSQFVNELKKTSFASRVTSVTLGSRQNMCINPQVRKLKSLALMNERCLDLQKKSKGKKTTEAKKTKGCGGCEFFNHSGIEDLKRHILSQPADIEDLVTSAKKDFNACPYYATRKAAKEAQLILMPYNTILHSGTREAINLRVQNSVLLLDEAHNIIESISNMYSTSISEPQLQECSNGLKTYISRYMSRFNPKNLLQLKQIGFMIKSFLNYLKDCEASKQKVFHTAEFKSTVGIEALDIYSLLKFINKSRLIFKVRGYLQLQEESDKAIVDSKSKKPEEPKRKVFQKSASGQSILSFSAFVKSLATSSANGRIIQDGKVFKFLLLNPAEDFTRIVSTSRSIILAGGTMKPYEDIEDQLFHSARDRIKHFSCNHVIPPENLVCLALSHGPTSTCLDFTFKNRNSPALLEELSRVVLNVGRMVPGGLIVFLPSYDYENIFYQHLKDSSYLIKIEQKKKIFREPKESSNTEKLLDDYSRQIRNNSGGAILFAVVGGKLSEGINFADDLGRCVIVVGLPYPNITSVEIQEKINFIANKFGSEKSKQLLPNACFKAVNQSIGRSVRHSKDYSAIILLDNRFLGTESQNQLPSWIMRSYSTCTKFGQCISLLGKFYSSKTNVSSNLSI